MGASIARVWGGEQSHSILRSKAQPDSEWSRVLSAINSISGDSIPLNQSSSLPDLIRYQMLFNDKHLRVELISHIAESAIATVRRLQQG